MRRVFVSDCEGPISKNDNAFEVTSQFVPNGDKLYAVISRYDDVLAYVLRKPSYEAGDTLKLVLPFLKAYDMTDGKMREYSFRNLILVPNSKETLHHVRNIAHAFIVSTSYEHYIRALCVALGFPYANTYCTELELNRYSVTEAETTRLKAIAQEIAEMPIFEVPPSAESLDDFPEEDQKTIRRLDEVFWEEVASMDASRIIAEVNPVGGSEKALALKDIVEKSSTSLEDVMYVGDSITDVEAFSLVRKNRGISVSFNGNQYAIKNAEVAVLSETSVVTAIIADVFCRFGKTQALELVENWSFEALKGSHADRILLSQLFRLHPKKLPVVETVTSENMESLVKESCEFRKKVRGEAVGRLG